MASVSVSKGEGHNGDVRRSSESPDKLLERPEANVNTMAELMQAARKRYGSKKILPGVT